MKSLILSFLLLLSSYAYSFNKCEFAKEEKAQIEKLENDLNMLEALHTTRMEDPELRVRLKNPDDEAEVGLLAEQLDAEVSELTGEQYALGAEMVATSGAFIVARIVIRKLKSMPDGHNLKIKYFKEVRMTKGLKTTIKGALSFTSIMLVASDIYLGYRMSENSNKKELLSRLIIELNKMETDLSERIIPLKRELKSRVIEFEELVEMLINDEIIEISNDKIICL